MISAANKIEGTLDENGICDITVSCDVTWQKRCYNSLNEIETVISGDTTKCIDYWIRSKICKICKSWRGRKGPGDPNCDINYQGSGLAECFQALEKTRICDTLIICVMEIQIHFQKYES